MTSFSLLHLGRGEESKSEKEVGVIRKKNRRRHGAEEKEKPEHTAEKWSLRGGVTASTTRKLEVLPLEKKKANLKLMVPTKKKENLCRKSATRQFYNLRQNKKRRQLYHNKKKGREML